MKAVNYSVARQKLRSIMDGVCKDHEPVMVTRKKGENVIMMSQEDFDSLVETDYLLSSPANARRLLKSLREAKKGRTAPFEFRPA